MRKNLTSVIVSLLEALRKNGFALKNYECDGDGVDHKKSTKRDSLVARNIDEASFTDMTLTKGGREYWVRIRTDNDPGHIVSDFTSDDELDSVMEAWSDAWENFEWVPVICKA